MKRIKAVFKKEFSHILRDPKSLLIVFLLPLVMIFIYGYAISYDLNNINTSIIDNSNSDQSKRLIDAFRNNGYFTVKGYATLSSALPVFERDLKKGSIHQIIVIPPDFGRKIADMRQTDLGFIIDGSDSNTANIIVQYNEQIVSNFINQYQDLDKILKIGTKVYFNIEVKSAFFFIPGLIAVLLIMISALLTSLSIAKERESGSLDLLFISPLRSSEIIIGKTLAYVIVAFTVEAIILLFSRFWFEIPIRGDLGLLFLFSLIYIITGLSLGIMISTIASDQKTAMLATLLVTMLPSIMLSGFIFPIDSLGIVLQYVSKIVPATYFLKIIRGIVLKDATLIHLYSEAAVLLLMVILLLTVATKKFSKERNKAK